MEIGSYLIVGVIVSSLAQIIKNKFGTSGTKTQIVVLAISIVAATAFFFLKDTVYWESLLAIFGFAGAVYAYFFKRLEDNV